MNDEVSPKKDSECLPEVFYPQALGYSNQDQVDGESKAPRNSRKRGLKTRREEETAKKKELKKAKKEESKQPEEQGRVMQQ